MSIELKDVERAHKRIKAVVRKTPLLVSNNEREPGDPDLYFKCENLQRGGAFKLRGAYNKISNIPESRRSNGVVAFSSGNHARAVATSAKLLGLHAKIVMPKDAPAYKLAATGKLGAEIILYDRYKEDRSQIAQDICETEGRTLVPPFDDAEIIAGQGTIGLDLLEQSDDLDYVVAPIGGGGLISGIATAIASQRPEIKIIGAETESANAGFLSLQKGERVEIPVPQTIADGMQVPLIGELTFEIIKKYVAEILLVTEDDIVENLRFAADEIKQIIEPTSAVAVAAARKIAERERDAQIAVILSGGNIDLEKFSSLVKR